MRFWKGVTEKMHELTGKRMITLTEHDNLEVEDEVVIDWCKSAVCEYLNITRYKLGKRTQAAVSAHPRSLFWYFSRQFYGITRKKLVVIAGFVYSPENVTIQSQVILLQSIYNLQLKLEIEEITKILKRKEVEYVYKTQKPKS